MSIGAKTFNIFHRMKLFTEIVTEKRILYEKI